MNKVKTIIFSLLTLMGVNAGYADTSIYTIPQSIACFTQYGVTAKELSEETAGVSVMQGEVASMISGLRNMGGHQDLITRLSEVAVMLSNYKAKLLNNTVCDKTQFINLMTESIAAGDKFLPLLNDMKNRFSSFQTSDDKENLNNFIHALAAKLAEDKELLAKAKAL